MAQARSEMPLLRKNRPKRSPTRSVTLPKQPESALSHTRNPLFSGVLQGPQEAKSMSAPARRAKVERAGAELSVRRQCALLNVARSGVYRPQPEASAEDLALMRRIDELYLEKPFYGSRRMTFDLNEEGRKVNRKRVQRLMRLMGLEGLVPRPGTSKAAPGNKIYPYLLRGVSITEPNHVWASDISVPQQAA